jgi:hypothetical protein
MSCVEVAGWLRPEQPLSTTALSPWSAIELTLTPVYTTDASGREGAEIKAGDRKQWQSRGTTIKGDDGYAMQPVDNPLEIRHLHSAIGIIGS